MSNTPEQIAEVIDKTNQIESAMTSILARLLPPVTSDYHFLIDAVLHNTCVNLGQKLRLFRLIADHWGWTDVDFGCFHGLIELRNAFAHTSTGKHQLVIWKDPSTNKVTGMGVEKFIERKAGLTWQEQGRDEAFQEFLTIHAKCLAVMTTLKDRIRKGTPEAWNGLAAEWSLTPPPE